MSIEKTLKINTLINVYGAMLNDKQRDIVTSYFVYDNSLSEIAENLNITRQAVSDLINRVVNTLENYEQKLGFVKKQENINKILTNLKLSSDKKTVTELQKINDILED